MNIGGWLAVQHTWSAQNGCMAVLYGLFVPCCGWEMVRNGCSLVGGRVAFATCVRWRLNLA